MIVERTVFEQQLRRWKRETLSVAGEIRRRGYYRDRREKLFTKRRRAERRRERIKTEEAKEKKSVR